MTQKPFKIGDPVQIRTLNGRTVGTPDAIKFEGRYGEVSNVTFPVAKEGEVLTLESAAPNITVEFRSEKKKKGSKVKVVSDSVGVFKPFDMLHVVI